MRRFARPRALSGGPVGTARAAGLTTTQAEALARVDRARLELAARSFQAKRSSKPRMGPVRKLLHTLHILISKLRVLGRSHDLWVWGGGWLAKLGALDFAGGTVVLTGVRAQKSWNGMADGLVFGNPRQLAVQALGVAAAAAWSAAGTFAILKLLARFAPLRAASREEGLGLDVTQHGEEAYARDEGAILILPETAPPAPLAATAPALEPQGS